MILLTGATGLAGLRFLELFLQTSERRIRALYRNEAHIPVKWRGEPRIQWIQGDITDIIFLETLDWAQIDTVVHMAGMVSFFRKDRKKMWHTNVEGTKNLVNMALKKGLQHLIYLSSVVTLTMRQQTPVAEEDTFDPGKEKSLSYYNRTKYYAELEVYRAMAEGLSATILAPSFILDYAPDFRSTASYFRLFTKGLCFYTSGKMGFVSAEDVARLAWLSVHNPKVVGQKIIVSSENVSYKDLNAWITQALWGNKKKLRAISRRALYGIMLVMRLFSFFTKSSLLLSFEMIKFAFVRVDYKNDKSLKYFEDFSYNPVRTVVRTVCACYNSQKKI